jgi:diadenosine tetraphosphate (Ap4A) HIT family hydrolase
VLADAHVTRFEALPLETWEQMARLAHAAARALERALQPTRCYVASLGTAIEDLPMTSPHLHVHVVPLHDPAARPSSVLSWEQGVLAFDEADVAELAHQLLAVWDA